MMTSNREPAWQDLGNIVFLEHVNLQVPDQSTAILFYIQGLGLTRDPYYMVSTDNMWANIGSQQLHLLTGPVQRFRGCIGLVLPDLDQVAQRLEFLKGPLATSAFHWSWGDGYLDVHCPWGNNFRIHKAYGDFPINMGIPYVRVDVSPGAAQPVAEFYREIFDAPVTVEKVDEGNRQAVVKAGPGIDLIYRETTRTLPAFDGHHICIYVATYSKSFAWLDKADLITLIDNEFQFRFDEIPGGEEGDVVHELQHEVRSLFHPHYRRHLVNRLIDEG